MKDLSDVVVLSIDDEMVLRQSIVAYLEDSGFNMIEANDGEEGLEVFRREKPDLVLTDLQMPKMSGLDVLTQIAKESPDTPIIVVSGAGGMSDVIEALRRGAWDYITKPITDLAVLEHSICKCLERSRLIEENKIYKAKLERSLDVLREDQEAGRSVQLKLLPDNNINLFNLELNYRFNPAIMLSGDFLDYFKIGDDKVVFYLADVSGHGSSSAFITILLKSIVTRLAAKYDAKDNNLIIKPDEVLEIISKELNSAKLGKYLTMAYLVYDHSTNEIIYSVGGHYPNPIVLEDGKARFLGGDGYPVGILPNAKYKTEKINLKSGTQMILLTDGIMEIVNKESMEDKESLLLESIEKSNGDLDGILEHLEMSRFEELPDDITGLSIVNK